MHRILPVLLAFMGCTAENLDPFDLAGYGYEYYPLEIGKYRIYRIDSIQFDLGEGNLPTRDSSTFYLREDFVEEVSNLGRDGENLVRIERYRSESLDGPWSIFDVITRSRTTNQAYSSENNVQLINLVFPVKTGIRWDGDAFVKDRLVVFVQGESLEMYKEWEFEILSSGVSEKVGENTYPDVVTVQQADSDNPIEKRYSIEKYAKDVGLIFREREIVDSYCKQLGVLDQCIGKEWIEKAGRGFFTRE
ncbi:MAG: hypothetical protein HKN76_21755, partial [Saprospiraceae bacterium]|nr:hypothetical protein [Saprospiraceae bacterium]